MVIVNQSLAQRYWPGEDAIGKVLTLDLVPDEQPRQIFGVVAAILAAVGIYGVMAYNVALTRLIADQLWGVTPIDPPTFVAVSLLLIIVALLACFVPTRRAVKVDPMITLRYE